VARLNEKNAWIPAFAGMTEWKIGGFFPKQLNLSTGRNDRGCLKNVFSTDIGAEHSSPHTR
jgi:hypothetical protein